MSSPTITKYGNDLVDPVVIPGWTVDIDGYGLVQSQVKFAWSTDYKAAFSSLFYRGAPHPDSYYGTYLKMVKANMQYGKGGVLNITADYIGIDPEINEGLRTNPVMQMTGSSSSEDITHHPNFFKINCTSIGTAGHPLAGAPPAAGGFETSLSLNPNRALWTPRVQNTGATNNCQFVAFLPAQKDTEPVNIKAGIKSYYKPQNTLRMTRYVTEENEALSDASYVGWFTDGDYFGMPTSYSQLAGAGGTYPGKLNYTAEYEAKVSRSYLVTACSVEQFGTIYKVTTDFMLSGLTGWDPDIYPGPTV
jgi:hypothetical protein